MAKIFWLALIVRLVWAATIPELDAPDEKDHLRAVQFFAEHRRLAEHDDLFNGPHGMYIAGSPVPYVPYAIAPHTTLFQLRCISALLGALIVLLSARIARRVSPGPLAIAVPLACALHPQLVFVTSTLSWDVVSILAATLLIATWPGLLEDRLTLGRSLAAGAVAGLVLLVKPSSFCVLPVHAGVFLFAVMRSSKAHAVAAFVACVAIALPILAHNWRLFPGDPFAVNVILHTVRADWPAGIPAPANLMFGTRYVITAFESFWGLYGWMNVKLPNVVYLGFAAATLLAAYGLVRAEKTPLLRRFLIATLATLGFAFAAAYWTNVANDYQPQGRYYFAAIVPLLGVWLVGLEARAKRTERVLAVTIGALAAVNIYSLTLLR